MLLGLVVFWVNMSKYEDKGNSPNPALLKAASPVGLSREWLGAIILGAIATVPVFSFLINAEGITSTILVIVGVICIGYLLITSFQSEDKAEDAYWCFWCCFSST